MKPLCACRCCGNDHEGRDVFATGYHPSGAFLSTARVSTLREVPLVQCRRAMIFIDEMHQAGRISSVEWEILRQGVWPMTGDDRLSRGTPLLTVRAEPSQESGAAEPNLRQQQTAE